MGKLYTVVHSFKQNIVGGAFENLAAGAGDSLAIPVLAAGSRGRIEEVVAADSANNGEFSVHSPRMHDPTRGLRVAYTFNPTEAAGAGKPQNLLPGVLEQILYSADTLTVDVNATATNNVQLDLHVYYDDLEGSDMSLVGWDEIRPRVVNFLGIRCNVVAGAAGDYGAARAINADDDRLISDTSYAVLGIATQVPCTLVTIKGPDTSNYRIPCSPSAEEELAADWFVDRSLRYGRPHIPVIKANNKGLTLLEAADPAGAVATAATVLLAELG